MISCHKLHILPYILSSSIDAVRKKRPVTNEAGRLGRFRFMYTVFTASSLFAKSNEKPFLCYLDHLCATAVVAFVRVSMDSSVHHLAIGVCILRRVRMHNFWKSLQQVRPDFAEFDWETCPFKCSVL